MKKFICINRDILVNVSNCLPILCGENFDNYTKRVLGILYRKPNIKNIKKIKKMLNTKL